jgi:hypothetical protein
MKKNRYPGAFKSLCRLRHSPLQAARDLYYVHVQLEIEHSVMRGDSYRESNHARYYPGAYI